MGTVPAKPHNHHAFVMNMKRSSLSLLTGTLLCAILATPMAVAAEAGAGSVRHGGLDLSLTRGDMNEAWSALPMTNATTNAPTYALPDFSGRPVGSSGEKASPQRGSAHRDDLPYGAGYEARQQDFNSGATSPAGSGGTNGGRGMGRRR